MTKIRATVNESREHRWACPGKLDLHKEYSMNHKLSLTIAFPCACLGTISICNGHGLI